MSEWREMIRKRTIEMEYIKLRYDLRVSDYLCDQYIYDMRGFTIKH